MSLPLFPSELGVSVWDTSAIIALKEHNIERLVRLRILDALRRRAADGRLYFPREVLAELERYVRPVGRSVRDELVEWARSCQRSATSVAVPLETVKNVLARVETLVDVDAHHDEADPYILALAIELKNQGKDVVVVTEDRRGRPTKISLSSACGVFRIPSLALMPFLQDEDLLPPA